MTPGWILSQDLATTRNSLHSRLEFLDFFIYTWRTFFEFFKSLCNFATKFALITLQYKHQSSSGFNSPKSRVQKPNARGPFTVSAGRRGAKFEPGIVDEKWGGSELTVYTVVGQLPEDKISDCAGRLERLPDEQVLHPPGQFHQNSQLCHPGRDIHWPERLWRAGPGLWVSN